MKIAISNIAWPPEDDEQVAALLRARGADAVEIAPSVYWPDPLVASPLERRRVRAAWEGHRLPVVAMQSLLFGHPRLGLFDPATRPALRSRLAGMLEVASDLGAGRLVLGSPRNRTRGALSREAALDVAVPFFQDLGREAEARGVCLCIEPNPVAYGCDFVTTAAEGLELVERVGSPGFGLHLDAAAMFLAGDDPEREIARSAPVLRHVHLSARDLGPVEPDSVPRWHAIRASLQAVGYSGYVSVEMRGAASRPDRLAAIDVALRLARSDG